MNRRYLSQRARPENKRYLMLEQLGTGTYGSVRKAYDLETHEFVAVKQIKHQHGEFNISQTTIQEIALLKEMAHENIVRFVDVRSDPLEKTVELVTELLETDFFMYLHRVDQRLHSEQFVRSVLFQVLKAVGYLHANWVIHRDLKPSNILLNGDGKAKLADFGFARSFQAPPEALSRDKVRVTHWYQPPEQALGAEMYAPSVDMWSMGCICAEAMTGLPLFQSSENRPEKVLENITTTLGDIEKQWAGVRAMAEYKKLKGKLAGGGGGGGGGGAPGKGGANVIGLGLRNRLEEKLDRLCEKERRRSLYPVEKHLIGQMVRYNPELRISAEQALLHPYFTVPPEEHPHLSIHRVEQLFASATASLARSLAADPQPVPLALRAQEGKCGLDEEIELGTASFDGHCAKCEADTLELPDIPLVPIAGVVAELQRKQIFAKVHVSEEDAATAEVFGKSGVCIAQLIREVEEFGVKEGKEEEQGTS